MIQQHIDAYKKRHEGWFIPPFRFADQSKSLPGQSSGILYTCPTCNEQYTTPEAAEDCFAQPFELYGVEVGDLVIIPNSNRYSEPVLDHWCAFHIPGDPDASSHFDQEDQWFPWYVVTSIHQEIHQPSHRVVATVMTLFDGELRGGWNSINGDGHHAMFHHGDKEQLSDVGSTWWTSERNGIVFSERVDKAQPCGRVLEEAKELADLRITSESLL